MVLRDRSPYTETSAALRVLLARLGSNVLDVTVAVSISSWLCMYDPTWIAISTVIEAPDASELVVQLTVPAE